MPHINHARGETRTFVVRRENWTTRTRWTFRRMRGRKGLAKRYMVLAGFGLRNWCPCCQPMHLEGKQGRAATRLVNRRDRIQGQAQCAEGLAEWEAR